MDDSDCEDTDWENYGCEDALCPCHSSDDVGAAPDPQAEPDEQDIPLDKRHVSIVLWLSADSSSS